MTILLPTNNRASMLPDAVESVMRQDSDAWRLIIVDNASADGTADYLATLTDPRISVAVLPEHMDDAGYETLHTAIGMWGGDGYACTLHDDDMMHPSRVRRLTEHMDRSGDDLVFSSMYTFTDATVQAARMGTATSDPWRCDPSVYALGIEFIIGNTTTPTSCFSSRMPEQPTGYTLGAQDTLWWLAAARDGLKLGFIDEPLYYYRMHGSQCSKRFGSKGEDYRASEIARLHAEADAMMRGAK